MHVKSGKSRPINHPNTNGNGNLWVYKTPKQREFAAQNAAKHATTEWPCRGGWAKDDYSETSKTSKIREEPGANVLKLGKTCIPREFGLFSEGTGNFMKSYESWKHQEVMIRHSAQPAQKKCFEDLSIKKRKIWACVVLVDRKRVADLSFSIFMCQVVKWNWVRCFD